MEEKNELLDRDNSAELRVFTARIPGPKVGTIRNYLRLFRRILAHPRVMTIYFSSSADTEITYAANLFEQDLGDRLMRDISPGEVLQRISILTFDLPSYEAITHILLKGESMGLVPSQVYVQSKDALLKLGWTECETFIGADVVEVESLPPRTVLFGLSPDSVCLNADVQQLWGFTVEEGAAGGVPVEAGLPAKGD